MIKKLIILHVTLLSLFAQKIYTVDELIIHALQNSPDINSSKLTLEGSKRKYDQQFGSYLPQIDLHANASYVHSKDMPLISADFSDTVITGSLSVSQLLYDFGKTTGKVANAKENIKTFDALLQEKVVQKKKQTKTAYYNILKNMALIKVNEESIKLNQAQLERSKRYYEAGIRTKVDISDAEVRLIKANIELQNSKFDLQNAYARLDRVVGFDKIGFKYTVYKPEVNLDKPIYDQLPVYDLSMDEAIRYGYSHRAELQSYIYKINAQKELEKVTKSRYFPSLHVNGNYAKTTASDYPSFLDKDQYYAGVYLNWNLFSGGTDKARIEEQKIRTQKSSADFKRKQLFIKEEITKAYIALNKTKAQVKLSQNLLKLSKEKFEQVSKQYKYGLSDYIELQEARQGYIDAKASLVINYYNYYTSIAILDATIGR